MDVKDDAMTDKQYTVVNDKEARGMYQLTVQSQIRTVCLEKRPP